jgi:hypothetical protein
MLSYIPYSIIFIFYNVLKRYLEWCKEKNRTDSQRLERISNRFLTVIYRSSYPHFFSKGLTLKLYPNYSTNHSTKHSQNFDYKLFYKRTYSWHTYIGIRPLSVDTYLLVRYIYIYIYIYIYTYIYRYIHTYINTYTYIYIYIAHII